ncbi:sigma-54 dependent transcriptional regulator [Pendulispora rubella]|uniref:Sigma-54 dependent transcriptional regulator n=1 Tax=Pendulispora rubella TaxID=2741070 RepID=A0ABZ2LE51_9BACT
MKRLLLVEDEVVIRSELCRFLSRHGYDVAEAGSAEEALERADLADVQLIVADMRLPGSPGTCLIERAGGVPVLIMTSYATVRGAVDAMKRGAVDYISKPFEFDELLATIERLIAGTQVPVPGKSRPPRADPFGLIGESSAMEAVRQRIRRIASSDATVLVLGPSGTGKELVARALHEHGHRAARPMVTLNCAAIPESLIESELFGHERGAFTGATSAYAGLFKAADGGTLFLDEIGELPLNAQARLLRVLQTGDVRPVGSSRTQHVDVRLVAATHRDLAAEVKEGTFRGDLYFRLRVLEVRLPSLREREGDVLALAQAFIERACSKIGRPALALSDKAISVLRAHAFPGNVRELENAIERAVVLSDGGAIGPEHLGLDAADEEAERTSAAPPAEASLSLNDYFRKFVLENQDKLTEAELARRLGMSRKALWERRQRMNLPRKR